MYKQIVVAWALSQPLELGAPLSTSFFDNLAA